MAFAIFTTLTMMKRENVLIWFRWSLLFLHPKLSYSISVRNSKQIKSMAATASAANYCDCFFKLTFSEKYNWHGLPLKKRFCFWNHSFNVQWLRFHRRVSLFPFSLELLLSENNGHNKKNLPHNLTLLIDDISAIPNNCWKPYLSIISV